MYTNEQKQCSVDNKIIIISSLKERKKKRLKMKDNDY